MKIIDKIAWLEIKDNKILSTLSKGKNVYYIPGGKREEEETDTETLIREIKEELSVDIIEDSMQYYGSFEAQAHGKEEGILVKMTCYTAKYLGKLVPDSEIQEMCWLSYEDKQSSSQVDQLIFDDLREKGLL